MEKSKNYNRTFRTTIFAGLIRIIKRSVEASRDDAELSAHAVHIAFTNACPKLLRTYIHTLHTYMHACTAYQTNYACGGNTWVPRLMILKRSVNDKICSQDVGPISSQFHGSLVWALINLMRFINDRACMHACMHYIHARIAYIQTYMHAYIHTYKHTRTHPYTHTRIHTCIKTHAHILPLRMHTCMH